MRLSGQFQAVPNLSGRLQKSRELPVGEDHIFVNELSLKFRH